MIEFARNVLGEPEANSTEFAPATPFPAVIFMPEGSTTHKGGTMRLGSRRTVLQTVDCVTARLYQVRPLLPCHARRQGNALWGFGIRPALPPGAAERAATRLPRRSTDLRASFRV